MSSNTIEHAFQAAIASGKINGAIICATSTSGDFTYTTALGERTLLSGEKRPQQLDDVLYLASASKLITTIAILQCVEDGSLLSLDDATNISRFAPELAALKVLESDDPDAQPVPPKRPLTLAMLLAHTSGLSYEFLVPRIAVWRQRHAAPEEAASTTITQRPVEQAFAYPLASHPGTSGLTYGPGLDWAGRILERATGSRLGEHVRRRIAAPLGVTEEEVQFYPVDGEGVRGRMVDLNPEDPEGFGIAVAGNSAGAPNRLSLGDMGGHGLFMTGEGYLRVLASLCANDGKLLRRETVEMMFENWVGPDAEEGFRATVEGPWGPFFCNGIDPKTKLGYGLGGLLTLEDIDGWYGERTLTWGGGLTFAWFIDRKNGLCGLAAPQAALPVDAGVVTELKQVFRRDIYNKYDAWKKERGA